MKSYPKKSKCITMRFRLNYILALFLIAILIASGQLFLSDSLSVQENDSGIINIAGQQRMLSQKIVKHSLELLYYSPSNDNNYSAKEFADTLTLWRSFQNKLQQSDFDSELSISNNELINSFYADIEPYYQSILSASYQILNAYESDSLSIDSHREQIKILLENERLFLEGMNKIVSQYEIEAKERVLTTENNLLILVSVTLILIILEGFYIFYPAEKKIKESLDALYESEEHLSFHATIDEMTNILNRRTGVLALEEEIEKVIIDGSDLTICFIDVDGLKSVNDNYGHLEGDWLIKTITSIISHSIRSDDRILRYGGDEFIIIFSNTNLKTSTFILDKILLETKNVNTIENKPFKLSFSYGFSTYQKDHPHSLEDFVNIADQRMYKHKVSNNK